MKVILHYLEESWLGRTQNRVLGVIYTYDPQNDNRTRIKDVHDRDVLARLEGSWTDQVQYTLSGSKVSSPRQMRMLVTNHSHDQTNTNTTQEPQILVDLNPLFPSPKIVPPESSQLPNESQRFWAAVTAAIRNKQFGQATKLKQELEERQREKAAARAERKDEWRPRFFTKSVTPSGRPELTEEGRDALRGLQAEEWSLTESAVTGA